MGDASTPDHPKPVLDVGIITVLTVLANKLLPADNREVATTIIPVIGGILAWAFRSVRKHYGYQRMIKLEERWLAEVKIERAKPGLSRSKCAELDADIAKRKQALEALQRENTKLN